MAISYVGAGAPHSPRSGSTTSWVLGLPSGVTAGDLLVAVLVSGLNSGSTTAGPSGWTQLFLYAAKYPNNQFLGQGIAVYYKTATASEASSFTFTQNTSGSPRSGVMLAYRGATMTTQFATAYSETPNCTAPTVTTTGPQQYVVSIFGNSGGASNNYFGAPPASFNVRFADPSAASSAACEVVDTLQAAAGASTAPTAYNYSSSTTAAMAAIAIATTNAAPAAPTLNTPSSASTVDRSQPADFTWTPSDADPGDIQSAFDLQYRPVGSSTWTTISQTTSISRWTAAASTFTSDTQYEWRVRTYDQLSVVGPYSASQQFLAATPQPAPTITVPAASTTVTQPNTTLTFTAPNVTASQWRVMGDTSGSANSTVILAGETTNDGAVRTFAVNGLPNNVTAHFQVRVLYQGLWSPWADRSVAVAFTLPMAPVATLTAQDASGSMLVTITNPTPTGGAPTTTSNEVWVDDGLGAGLTRRATGIAVNGSFTYWLPVGGRDYSGNIVVRALAATGAASTGIAT